MMGKAHGGEDMLPKIYERNQLAKKLGCCPAVLSMYLCRSEFWHIAHRKINRKMYYIGMTPRDMDILKKFIETRPRGCRRGIKKNTIV